MKDLFKSENNIRIGHEEISCICNFLSITKDELISLLSSGDLSFYFKITYEKTHITAYCFDNPPFITYDLIILYKKDSDFYTMIFSKDKYPMEYNELNNIECYQNLLPIEYPSIEIDFPIFKHCRNNNILSFDEINIIKSILSFNNKFIPLDVTDLILSFICIHSYDKSIVNFIITDEFNIGSNIKICYYPYIFKSKLLLAIKT